jgi:hypothetical protein
MLAILGFSLNSYFISPMISTWAYSYNFSDDLPGGIYKLFIANISLMPALIIASYTFYIS